MLPNPIDYLNPISRYALSTVDEEIRPVIRYLNRIPYVRTLFSCAGYGLGAKGPFRRGATSMEHKPYKGMYEGYIFLHYIGPKPAWYLLHATLAQHSDHWRKRAKTQFHTYPNQYAYYLNALTQEELAEKWKRLWTAIVPKEVVR